MERATHLMFAVRRRKVVGKSEPEPNFKTDTPFSRLALGYYPNSPYLNRSKGLWTPGLIGRFVNLSSNAMTYGIYISCAFVTSRFFMGF